MDGISAIVARVGLLAREWGIEAPSSAAHRCRGSPRTAPLLLWEHFRSGYPRSPGRHDGPDHSTGNRTMRRTRLHGMAILIALAMLVTIAPAPASALTLHRSWSAKVGSSGANGSIALKAYTNGVGSIGYSLKKPEGECDLQGPDPQRHVRESGHGGGQAALGPDVGDRDGGTHGQPAPVADDTDLAGGPPQDLHRQDRERDIDPLRRLHLRPGDPRRRSRASASTSRSSADRPATRSVGSRCTSRRSPSLVNPGSRSSTPTPGAGCSCRC